MGKKENARKQVESNEKATAEKRVKLVIKNGKDAKRLLPGMEKRAECLTKLQKKRSGPDRDKKAHIQKMRDDVLETIRDYRLEEIQDIYNQEAEILGAMVV